jgi:hypothetical protein
MSEQQCGKRLYSLNCGTIKIKTKLTDINVDKEIVSSLIFDSENDFSMFEFNSVNLFFAGFYYDPEIKFNIKTGEESDKKEFSDYCILCEKYEKINPSLIKMIDSSSCYEIGIMIKYFKEKRMTNIKNITNILMCKLIEKTKQNTHNINLDKCYYHKDNSNRKSYHNKHNCCYCRFVLGEKLLMEPDSDLKEDIDDNWCIAYIQNGDIPPEDSKRKYCCAHKFELYPKSVSIMEPEQSSPELLQKNLESIPELPKLVLSKSLTEQTEPEQTEPEQTEPEQTKQTEQTKPEKKETLEQKIKKHIGHIVQPHIKYDELHLIKICYDDIFPGAFFLPGYQKSVDHVNYTCCKHNKFKNHDKHGKCDKHLYFEEQNCCITAISTDSVITGALCCEHATTTERLEMALDSQIKMQILNSNFNPDIYHLEKPIEKICFDSLVPGCEKGENELFYYELCCYHSIYNVHKRPHLMPATAKLQSKDVYTCKSIILQQ